MVRNRKKKDCDGINLNKIRLFSFDSGFENGRTTICKPNLEKVPISESQKTALMKVLDSIHGKKSRLRTVIKKIKKIIGDSAVVEPFEGWGGNVAVLHMDACPENKASKFINLLNYYPSDSKPEVREDWEG